MATGIFFSTQCSVLTIGEGAFQWSSLETITLPNVINIDKDAFRDIYTTRKIFLPKVETLGDAAFDDNHKMEYFSAPELKTIGRNVFNDSSVLISVYPPKLEDMMHANFGVNRTMHVMLLPSLKQTVGNMLWRDLSCLVPGTCQGVRPRQR